MECPTAGLADALSLWRRWGFEPWSHEELAGVRRRVAFKKTAFLGEVAAYYAHDFVVWTHRGDPDCRAVFDAWRPQADVALHRFVFVMERVVCAARRRSFWFGLKGYLEVYQYHSGKPAPRGARDLTDLIDLGWQWVRDNAGR
jgi:hypothetical protein